MVEDDPDIQSLVAEHLIAAGFDVCVASDGEAAMTITQISRASLLPKENPFSWDLVPLPAGPAGEYAVIGQAGQ